MHASTLHVFCVSRSLNVEKGGENLLKSRRPQTENELKFHPSKANCLPKCCLPWCHGAGQLVANSSKWHSIIHSCRINQHPHRRISGSQGQKKSDFFGIWTERNCFTTDWQSTSRHWQSTFRHWRLLTLKKRFAMNVCYKTMRGDMRRKCSMMKVLTMWKQANYAPDSRPSMIEKPYNIVYYSPYKATSW